MAKKEVGSYASQGSTVTGEGGVWEWDSRTSPSRGSRGKLQMAEGELQRRWKCKRQSSGGAGWRRREGADGEGGKRGWVEHEGELARRQRKGSARRGARCSRRRLHRAAGGCCRGTC